jgi:hypothetical protein
MAKLYAVVPAEAAKKLLMCPICSKMFYRMIQFVLHLSQSEVSTPIWRNRMHVKNNSILFGS